MTKPYFYIIQHIISGRKYAGCRYARGCDPIELLNLNGYFTSSRYVKEIIFNEGVEAFKILCIITEFNGITALEYETNFIRENNCAHSNEWLNLYDNTGGVCLGTVKFRESMTRLYGKDNPMKIDIFKNKAKATNLEKRGVAYPAQDQSVKLKMKNSLLLRYGVTHQMHLQSTRDKMKLTCMNRYGVEFASQSDCVRDKMKLTCMNRYGHEHYFQTDEFKLKQKETSLLRYGVENPAQRVEVKDKMKLTCMNRYGVEFASQSDRVKEKVKATNLDRYGVEFASQSDCVKEKVKETSLLRYGVENPAQRPEQRDFQSIRIKKTWENMPLVSCVFCKVTMKRGPFNRYHNESCKKRSY